IHSAPEDADDHVPQSLTHAGGLPQPERSFGAGVRRPLPSMDACGSRGTRPGSADPADPPAAAASSGGGGEVPPGSSDAPADGAGVAEALPLLGGARLPLLSRRDHGASRHQGSAPPPGGAGALPLGAALHAPARAHAG